jgi:hypothetical protein
MAIPDTITKGWIAPAWDTHHRDLEYDNEPFNDKESLDYWQQLGYTQTKFTGDMYDMRNSEPSWMPGITEKFNWEHISWSVYRMGPGCVLPRHSDTYARFCKLHNVTDINNIVRGIVMLEDWASGHYLEINDVGLTNWRAGDYFIWRGGTPHTAANVGLTNRYTLQLTGILKYVE